MKLIIIHGALAVGKYTVGKKLEKEIGFKLIHIHSIYDLLESIFGKEKYYTSLDIINNTLLDIINSASKNKIKGLIITYAELAKDNFKFAKNISKKLQKPKDKIFFISLICDKQELAKRVLNKSRKKFNKTKTVAELKYLLSIKNYNSTLSGSKTLKIDNTDLPPQKTVKEIKKFIRNG